MALHPTRRSILAGAILAGLLPVAPGLAQVDTGRAPVVGAGSTFAYPVVSRWAKGYHRWVAGGGTIPIAGGGSNVNPLTSYTYRTVGVKIDMTPRVTYQGEIVLDLYVENSARGRDSAVARLSAAQTILAGEGAHA